MQAGVQIEPHTSVNRSSSRTHVFRQGKHPEYSGDSGATRDQAGGAAASSMHLPDWAVPKQLQLSQPIVVLGRGSCGEVLQGSWHSPEGHSQEVAVKFAFNPDDVQCLQHETAVYTQLKYLQGSCIPCEVASGFLEGGSGYFLALQLIHGKTLRPEHRRKAAIMQSALSAVRSLHSKGVLHMDLQPSNIMANDDKVWLLDFSHANVELDSYRPEDVAKLRHWEENQIQGSLFACVAWASELYGPSGA